MLGPLGAPKVCVSLGRSFKSGKMTFLGRILGPSWAILGHLGAILGDLRAILGHLGAILGHLGVILGHLGPILASSWASRVARSLQKHMFSFGF